LEAEITEWIAKEIIETPQSMDGMYSSCRKMALSLGGKVLRHGRQQQYKLSHTLENWQIIVQRQQFIP